MSGPDEFAADALPLVDTAIAAERIACDAMCGGLARWLRMLGYDCSYTPGIDDGALVTHALAERRVIISADRRLFERRPLTRGMVAGILLPVGLPLREQVHHVRARLATPGAAPRCTHCNGELELVSRSEVADVVPARSLLLATPFYRCRSCRHVYWVGTHWRRIRAVLSHAGGRA